MSFRDKNKMERERMKMIYFPSSFAQGGTKYKEKEGDSNL